METEATTHVRDPDGDGMGRLPRKMYAVRLRGVSPTTGRKVTAVFTHERKPLATRHHATCVKHGMDADLLEGEIEWQVVK